jgi:hypothetical protein
MPTSEKDLSQWLEPDFPHADARPAFAARSEGVQVPSGVENAFLMSKLKILRSHPGPPAERRRLEQSFLGSLNLTETLIDSEPVGGRVGYGMFYNPIFKTAFQSGTGLAWGIVFSNPPGGNVATWLYLTGMNRASMGAEAFIAYNGQNDITFNVFDWARSPRLQPPVPLQTMMQYVGTVSANGSEFPAVMVANLTYQNGPTSWVNEIKVLNQSTKTLDLAYQFIYPATLEQQTTPAVGSWAPIVETFQSVYSGTNPMGCFGAKLATSDAPGSWGPWTLLDPSQIYPRADNQGFHPVVFGPNYSWAVTS